MKILYVTTTGITMTFFKEFVKTLIKNGHTVDIATNETESRVPECYEKYGCNIYHISTSRAPLDRGNFNAIKQLKKLVNKERYDIVHCHTPIASMCTRIACRKIRKKGTKIFYTAHGFHFYKGAPLKNWLIYYPVERICAHFTDVLITINQEDYALALKKMKAKRVKYVHGVGIDLKKFESVKVDKTEKRNSLGIPENAMLLLSVGELNENKNHEKVIRAIAGMDVYYIIAGIGNSQEYLQSIINELGLTERIHLLGFRRDIEELCAIADIFVFPSFREGLSVSVMEAMASGLPVVCSRIRGNVDLINENGGVLFTPNSVNECRDAICTISKQNLKLLGAYNKKTVTEFTLSKVNNEMRIIYKEVGL